MNPYEVLGVRQGASQAEIKAAYKKLVKQYHPDRYQNNPLAGLAEEKLQEINEAYDMLMNGNTGTGAGTGTGGADFGQARRYIDSGNLDAAERILAGSGVRNAEWHFLKGVIATRKGWYDEGISSIQTAVSMDPGNAEYTQHLNSLMNRGGFYQNQAAGRGYARNDDMCCQALQCYVCADCCCDCI